MNDGDAQTSSSAASKFFASFHRRASSVFESLSDSKDLLKVQIFDETNVRIDS